MTNQLVVNEKIRARTVRLIDAEGTQVGIVPLREAQNKATDAGLDLVLIAAGDPPVCRILDAGKYNFQKKKQEREQAKRQRELSVVLKELQLRPGTDDHDLEVKSRKAREFLTEGDKVKIIMKFRGREQVHKNEGRKVIDEFLASIGVEYKIDSPLKDGGRDMMMILAPTKTKAEILKERDGATS